MAGSGRLFRRTTPEGAMLVFVQTYPESMQIKVIVPCVAIVTVCYRNCVWVHAVALSFSAVAVDVCTDPRRYTSRLCREGLVRSNS